ncbi:MAG: glycoside hydrolase family 66 protein [Lachnospiraceae bacterium]|nr:glycoside hydrolase family 66 protein [Lachnospiraceae bacterium]
MKKRLVIISTLLLVSLNGCGREQHEAADNKQEEIMTEIKTEAVTMETDSTQPVRPDGNSADNNTSGTDTKTEEDGIMEQIIKDVYTDKARYDIGEMVEAYVELESSDTELVMEISVRHLTEEVYHTDLNLSASDSESTQTIQIPMPADDFKGYSLEVYALRDGKVVDYEMSAIEVASDWSKFPRYAYLTRYGEQTDEEIQETLERLNKHHITGLFFYDVLNRHEKPAAGTAEEPAAGWHTLANSYASYETVSKLIDYGHTYHMNSYLYNLIFGAYEDYEESGVKPEWGLYRDASHEEQDYHGDFVDSWATKRLYLFNPADREWQDYYLGVTEEALTIFPYDGIQVDSLGGRGVLYDYDGTAVELKDTYTSLLNRITDELDTRVIFNPVSGYGMMETLNDTDYDIVYEEVWPWETGTYGSLKAEVDYLRGRMNDDTGIVIAAYMDYQKRDGVFNTPGVLLTDAALMSAGAAHLEIGDTGMLKSEYYPGDTLRINDTLTAALRNYYSFFVAYENYLRDASWKDVLLRTYINDKAAAMDAKQNAIWVTTKENDAGEQVVSFINLKGVDSLEWVDNHGEQKEPEKQENLTVLQHITFTPEHIYLASPDIQEGIMTELSFETGEDSEGTYVTFTMPELNYWNMVVIK